MLALTKFHRPLRCEWSSVAMVGRVIARRGRRQPGLTMFHQCSTIDMR